MKTCSCNAKKEYVFNARAATDSIIDWIKAFYVINGNKSRKAIVGISGGKDSAVVAALCVAALGKERVIGVKLPNGEQYDIDFSNKIISYLDIASEEIDINKIVEAFYEYIPNRFNSIVFTNLPARVRMTMLYAIASSRNGFVVNTNNLSENYLGYVTKYGDAAGDFAPIKNYTSTEVIEIGKVLGLPEEILLKKPEDGLSGLLDEDNTGVSYSELDTFLRENIYPDAQTLEELFYLHCRSSHKRKEMPSAPFKGTSLNIVSADEDGIINTF